MSDPLIRSHSMQWAAENAREHEYTMYCCLLGCRVGKIADEYRRKANMCWLMAIAGLIAKEKVDAEAE